VPSAFSNQLGTSDAIVDKVVTQEQSEVWQLRNYSPLVETYLQYFHLDRQSGTVPDGDKYFLGRAKLTKGVELELLAYDLGLKRKLSEDWREFLNIGFSPKATAAANTLRPIRRLILPWRK